VQGVGEGEGEIDVGEVVGVVSAVEDVVVVVAWLPATAMTVELA